MEAAGLAINSSLVRRFVSVISGFGTDGTGEFLSSGWELVAEAAAAVAVALSEQ